MSATFADSSSRSPINDDEVSFLSDLFPIELAFGAH